MLTRVCWIWNSFRGIKCWVPHTELLADDVTLVGNRQGGSRAHLCSALRPVSSQPSAVRSIFLPRPLRQSGGVDWCPFRLLDPSPLFTSTLKLWWRAPLLFNFSLFSCISIIVSLFFLSCPSTLCSRTIAQPLHSINPGIRHFFECELARFPFLLQKRNYKAKHMQQSENSLQSSREWSDLKTLAKITKTLQRFTLLCCWFWLLKQKL